MFLSSPESGSPASSFHSIPSMASSPAGSQLGAREEEDAEEPMGVDSLPLYRLHSSSFFFLLQISPSWIERACVFVCACVRVLVLV